MRFSKFFFIFLVILGLIVFTHRTIGPDLLSGVGFSREVLASKGELLRLTLSVDDKYRIFRPLDKIHPELQEAVLLLEDQYFYYHPGINPLSLGRALASVGTDRKIGASTITMQMVRLKHKLFTRSFTGKIQQMLYALYYELLYSKKEILQAYLNLAPYGGNIEGVEAASRIYFGKTAKDLNLLESLTLAVIPQNPLKRNLNQAELVQVDQARQKLTQKWLEKNPQDKLIIEESSLPVLSNRIRDLPFEAPHFVQDALQKDPQDLLIRSTIDWEIQKQIEERLKTYLAGTSNRGVKNGSVLLIEGATGEIKAWAGSGDFFNSEIQGQIDGVNVLRSPGSTLKPFVFGRALDEGLIHPSSLLKDSPSSFGTFDPENFDRRFLGPISATQALVQSRNVPAIQLAAKIQEGYLYEALQKIGVPNLRPPQVYGLGIAIGTAEISPMHLGSLYTALYNGGKWQPLISTRKKKTSALESFQLLTPEGAYLVREMLRQSPRESSSVLNDQKTRRFPMAWKTGTSYGFRDAWTAGIFGPFVMVVWLGNFDYSDNPHLIGRELAAPLFFQIAELFPKEVLQNHFAWTHSFGLNLKKVEVCSVSGALPGESCPHKIKESFVPGVSPIATCQLHQRLMISKKNGLRLCGQNISSQDFSSEVFEFWPSDLLEIFQKFGVRRRTPPAFDPSCDGVDQMQAGFSPEILSPKKDLKYLVSFAKTKLKEKIPLKALVDADVKELSWFVNREFIGKSKPDETLFYEAGPGHYDFIVVDDRGRLDSREVDIKAGL